MSMCRIYVGAAVLGCSMLVGKSALAQCQRDTDCKGARVCLGGQCVDRPAPAPAAAPAPVPAPQPVYAPAPQPQPQPQPAYAPQPQPQPAYAPQPQPQPAYPPQPQPVYAPQSQPQALPPPPPPGAAPATMGGGAAVGVGAGGAAGTAMPPVAAAPRLGMGMHFVVSAERLFGFNYWMASASPTMLNRADASGIDASIHGTQFAFLAGGASTGYDQMQINPYAVPRLAFDAVLNGGFSVGGSLFYFATSGSSKVTQAGVEGPSIDCPAISAVGFAPRGGFVFMFNDMVGIWPRLGFTYVTSKTSTPVYNGATKTGDRESSQTFLSIDPEALLVITPVPHFGITVGLQGSVGVAGTFIDKDTTGVSVDEYKAKLTNIGLTCGMLGYF